MGYGDNQPTFDKYTGGNGARKTLGGKPPIFIKPELP
jgi:hypothetical protein